jgi:hypothetical protein
MDNIRKAEFLLNPPIVTPVGDEDRGNEYVILDGANRCFAFQQLGYPHILAQVVTYTGGNVTLDVWHHIVSRWKADLFVQSVQNLNGIELHSGQDETALAHVLLEDGQSFAVRAFVKNLHERNAILRQFVKIYQTQAVLDRTASNQFNDILPLYPEAIALVVFPNYAPDDILAAAKQEAYLPPGISRHIIQGRAVRVNFSVEILRDTNASLEAKNEALKAWMQRKFANRQVRYYAESTYQFDE